MVYPLKGVSKTARIEYTLVNHFSWKARINSIHPYFLTKLVEF
ncbi:hypothetical protein BSM4216_2224 [Bacillus smithii]|nr:hypothetical protein BSM4216_2224 [Bacillus smithii]